MRRTWLVAALLGALALAGCGSASGSGSSASPSSAAAASDAVLATGTSPLGTVVVTAAGRAVYVFDADIPGSGVSACSGACAQTWPAVTTDAASPVVDGVTGTVGTLTRDDGTTQLTLDGRPLYRYAGDTGSGQTAGQGVQGSWWVVGPDGTAIRAAAPSSPPAGPVY